MKVKVFASLLFFILSLSINCQTNKTFDNYIRISYPELINNPQTIELSKIALSVNYIKLETNENCLIFATGAKYFFAGNFIFVSNMNNVLRFTKEGKFINSIGRPGRGPGEINGILSMSVLLGKEQVVIHEQGGTKLSYFSFNGHFIKSVKIPYTVRLILMDNGNRIAYDESGLSELIFRLSNDHGDTISVVPNKSLWRSTSTNKIRIAPNYPSEPFYSYDNSFYFKARYTDTVYTIISNKIRPKYFIDLGNFKLPEELRPERDLTKFLEKKNSYYYCSVFEVSDKLLISCFCYGKASDQYLYFDKKTLKGCLLVKKSGQSTGFINDWDGGLDFYPSGNINKNQAYMPINILQLKQMPRKNDQNIIKNGNNKILEKLINDSDVLDNPILMIVTIN